MFETLPHSYPFNGSKNYSAEGRGGLSTLFVAFNFPVDDDDKEKHL